MGLGVLKASDDNVKVLLPLLDEAIPLAPAILPPLVRSPGHPCCALVLGDEADVPIIAHGVLAIRDLLFPPKFIKVSNCDGLFKNKFQPVQHFLIGFPFRFYFGYPELDYLAIFMAFLVIT